MAGKGKSPEEPHGLPGGGRGQSPATQRGGEPFTHSDIYADLISIRF